MLAFEKDLFEDFMRCIEKSDKRLMEGLSGGKEEEKKNELILFKTNVEEFMGLEGEKIGPFETGQVANISSEIAKILVEDGKADIIER
jgi:hypothetical protein